MRFYRVFVHVPSAAPDEPGGALYIPPQGSGRIDNAEYQVLYIGDSRAGVCAEAFNYGRYRLAWSNDMLRGIPMLPNSVRALAWYDVTDDAAICNLDDPKELTAQQLRPSSIVTRDYSVSQAWALRLFQSARWAGVSWWSYHDARWASVGFWHRNLIVNHGIEALTMNDPGILEAARLLNIAVP